MTDFRFPYYWRDFLKKEDPVRAEFSLERDRALEDYLASLGGGSWPTDGIKRFGDNNSATYGASAKSTINMANNLSTDWVLGSNYTATTQANHIAVDVPDGPRLIDVRLNGGLECSDSDVNALSPGDVWGRLNILCYFPFGSGRGIYHTVDLIRNLSSSQIDFSIGGTVIAETPYSGAGIFGCAMTIENYIAAAVDVYAFGELTVIDITADGTF